jgi:hypothetical protein
MPKRFQKIWVAIANLSGPKNWNDVADLLSKTVFAAASALIAFGVWAYSDYRESLQKELDRQQKRHELQLTQAREGLSDRRDVINLFLQFMPKDFSDPQISLKVDTLSSYCSETDRLGRRSRVEGVLCENVGRFGVDYAARTRASASSAATSAARTDRGQDYLDSPAAAAQSVALAASEAAAPVETQRWYAVIASVPLEQEQAVPAIARELQARMAGRGMPSSVRIYRTKISNSFALTSGGEKSEEDAKGRARALRRFGIVPDAFAQPDREWSEAAIRF